MSQQYKVDVLLREYLKGQSTENGKERASQLCCSYDEMPERENSELGQEFT